MENRNFYIRVNAKITPNTKIYLVSSYDCVQSSQCSGDLFCYYFKCVQAS